MAGQDIKKRLNPGQPQQVNVGGDYIFLKFADRPIDIVITGGRSGGTRVTMEAGDKYRPGRFDSFEVQNTDQNEPAQLILTVGEGDYNRQFVTGKIDVLPGVYRSDGVKTIQPLQEKNLYVKLDYKREPAITQGDASLIGSGANMINASGPNASGNGFWLENREGGEIYLRQYSDAVTVIDEILIGDNENIVGTSGSFSHVAKIGNAVYFADNSENVYRITNYDGRNVTGDDLIAKIGSGNIKQFFVKSGKVKAFNVNGEVWDVDSQTEEFDSGSSVDFLTIANINGVEKLVGLDGGSFPKLRYWSMDYVYENLINVTLPDGVSSSAAAGVVPYGPFNLPAMIQENGTYLLIQTESAEPGEVLYGFANDQCLTLNGFYNPETENNGEIRADISVRWFRGYALVSGEVLGGVLQLLGIVNPEYMDLITRVEYPTTNGQVVIDGGGYTLLGADLVDQFSDVQFPGVIKITALKELWQ